MSSSSKPADHRGAIGHWSDGETTALVQAWGQLYLQHNRLSEVEWREVCGAVNAHRAAAGCLFDRSVAHCQWRLYSLKSKYKKEVAKGQPTSGWRHFAQLRAFLGGPDNGPPPGFAAMTPPAPVKEEEVEVEEASGSVPAKRKFSSLEDILGRSGGPPPGFPPRMPATAKKEDEEEVVGLVEGPPHGVASAECLPGAVVTKLGEVVTKLAEVYLEMERLGVEKQKMAMEWEMRAAKVEAENQLEEAEDS
uniref:Uncharacterized protein n=1 Tax=Avena sativa TaxID=4498 RepID=A0ACD5X3C8_AVESA